MYKINFILKDSKLSIPIDKFCNQHNDINIFSIIKPKLYEIYGFLLNNKYLYDGFVVQLLDDDILLCEKKIMPEANVICHFEGFKPSSNLDVEKIIEDLFDELESYLIEIKNGEISKVTFGNDDINLEWFINNIYRNTDGRYYRKISTFLKIKIFKRDTKC